MSLHLFLVVAGCAAVYFGAEALIRGASGFGRRLQMSPGAVGLILVSLATSAPELAVSMDAALRGHGDIAVGNVVGSNIANIALVLGLAALAWKMAVPRDLGGGTAYLMLALTVIAVLFLVDGQVSRMEGFALLGALAIGLWLTLKRRPDSTPPAEGEIPGAGDRPRSVWRDLALTVGGALVLVLGAEAMVAGGVGVARAAGISEAVIGLTLIAVGTGVPEIAATVVAVARKQVAVAFGNIIGSNLINLGLVLGSSAVVAPLIASEVGVLPLITLLVFTLLLWLLTRLASRVNRWSALALLSGFGAYQAVLIA